MTPTTSCPWATIPDAVLFVPRNKIRTVQSLPSFSHLPTSLAANLMNQDVLYIVATFSDRATLSTICCVSQETRRVAARQLYRTVRVRRLDDLAAVHGALARDSWLQPHVVEFFSEGSLVSLRHLRGTGSKGSTSTHNAALHVRAFVEDILPRLANLEAFALDCPSFPAELRALLAETLAALPGLRSIKLPCIGADNLHVFRAAQTPLEHIVIREHSEPSLAFWIADHAATLRSLRIDNCGGLITRLTTDSNSHVFPRLHTLRILNDFHKLPTHCACVFPVVRSLSDQRPLRGAAAGWPLLEHLDAFAHDIGEFDRALPYGPSVRSMRLRHSGPNLLERLKDWASPQITALELVFSTGGFAAHAVALGAFSGLRMMDVTLLGDRSETDTGVWVHKAASSLSVVPPRLEVLTLRGTGGSHDSPTNPLDALSRPIPTLRLLRIVLEQPSQRLAFTHQRPVDWLSACEMVADYLPHWRETRAPWDDIRDI